MLLLGRCALLHPSVAYRRQTILDLGGYDASFGLASDYVLWIDLLLKKYRAAVIPEPLIMYRAHRKRQSALKAHAHWNDTARAHEKFVRVLSKRNDIAVTPEQIGLVLESVHHILNQSTSVLQLRPDESISMRRTVYRWLGPGVKLGARIRHFPAAIFYPTVFTLSPLLIPGVRPAVTRLLESFRSLRTLPERAIE